MDTWVWIVIAAAVVVVLLLVAWVAWSNRRRRGLHDRFGKEYERTVESADSRRNAAEQRPFHTTLTLCSHEDAIRSPVLCLVEEDLLRVAGFDDGRDGQSLGA